MKRCFFRVSVFLIVLGIISAAQANADGRKENEYYPDGSLKKEYIAFDDNGNPTEYISHTGGTDRYADLFFTCTYDMAGRLETEKITLPDGTFLQFYTTEYDGNGYIARRTWTNEEGGAPAGVMEYTRDADGNCIRQVNRDLLTGETEDLELENGLVVRRTMLNGDGQVEYTGTLAYDEEGNFSEYRVLDGDGSLLFIQRNAYDGQGRVIHTGIYNETDALVSESDMEYSENGYTETEHEYWRYYTGTKVREYDEYGRMLYEKAYDENDKLSREVFCNSLGNEVRRNYYKDGNLAYSELYEYDEDGNLTETVTVTPEP